MVSPFPIVLARRNHSSQPALAVISFALDTALISGHFLGGISRFPGKAAMSLLLTTKDPDTSFGSYLNNVSVPKYNALEARCPKMTSKRKPPEPYEDVKKQIDQPLRRLVGRPPLELPDAIPDSSENIARIITHTKPKGRGNWRFEKKGSSKTG